MKINYKILGEGKENLLFLHGWGCDNHIFDGLIEELKYDYKIVNLDLFGFGQSELNEEIDDIYSYALNLFILIQELKLKKITIVTHSFGGRLALILASLFDLEIERLVLIGCAGLKPKRNLAYYLKVYKYKFLKSLKNIGLKNINLEKYGSDDYKKLSNEMKKLFVRVVNQDLGWTLKYINVKSDVIFGKLDKDTPIYMAKKLHRNILDSKLYLLKDCGHFCFLEESRKVLRIIKNKN